MSVFAVVRDFGELQCACDAISELLTTSPSQPTPALLGIWVEPGVATDVNALLMEQQLNSPGILLEDIQATCGITGYWGLCWLNGQKIGRSRLVQELLRVRPSGNETPPHAGCFIPVFDCAIPQSEVQADIGQLTEIQGAHILAPSYQESSTGRLLLAPVYGTGPSEVQ